MEISLSKPDTKNVRSLKNFKPILNSKKQPRETE